MKWRPTKLLFLVAVAASVLAQAPVASAQQFPSNVIKFIVPYTPGAGGDIVARIVSEGLAQQAGYKIVVENRGGAAGAIGTFTGAKAPPDGYTWILGADPAFTINPHLTKVPYDPVKDFSPVILLTKVPLLLIVNSNFPGNSVQDLVRIARADPNKLVFATLGSGSNANLAAHMLKSMSRIEFLHVPFKGQAEAITEILAGRADFTFSSVGPVAPHIKAGKLKALAVTTDQRFPGFPEVPTVAESGYPEFEASAWHGILLPAGAPPEIVAKVNEDVAKVLKLPDVASRMSGLGYVPVGGPPAALERLIREDSERWGKLIRERDIKAE